MITASQIQIAVALEDCDDAQAVFDTACPGDFDVTSVDRTVWAYASDPTVPAVAVAQGKIAQEDYALLATLALSAGVNHIAIGFWEGSTYTAAPLSGTLWEAMQIQTVEEPI